MNSTTAGPLLFSALFPWACIGVAALITPRLTRPDLFFAVTVPPGFRVSPAGAAILRSYNRTVLAFAVVSLLPLLFFKLSEPPVLPGLLGPTGVELLGFFAAFLMARRQTIPHRVEPTMEREASLAPRQKIMPGGWLAQIGPFLVLAGACGWLWMNWDKIPARIPIHFNASGDPDGWAGKSLFSVCGCVLIGILVCLMLTGIRYTVAYSVRRIHSSGKAGERELRFLRLISLLLLGMEYWLALLMSLLSLLALRANPEAPLPAFWPIFLIETLVIGSILVCVWITGQGGWRLGKGAKEEAALAQTAPIGDRTPDACWKLGLIYYNQNDPALFVEKRFGVGWTLNFGNPKSWLFFGAMLLFIAGTLVISLAMGRSR